jgi:hypothetical protein
MTRPTKRVGAKKEDALVVERRVPMNKKIFQIIKMRVWRWKKMILKQPSKIQDSILNLKKNQKRIPSLSSNSSNNYNYAML